VVLTSSANLGDIDRAKSLGVISYFVKPSGFEPLLQCAKEILAIRQELRLKRPVAGRFP